MSKKLAPGMLSRKLEPYLYYVLAIPVVGITFVCLLGLNGILNTLLRSLVAGAVK